MNPQRGRLLLEVLREARESVFEATGGVSSTDGREMSAAELAYIVEHHGRAPPGTEIICTGVFRLDGPEWRPGDEPEREPVEQSNVIQFPGSASASTIA